MDRNKDRPEDWPPRRVDASVLLASSDFDAVHDRHFSPARRQAQKHCTPPQRRLITLGDPYRSHDTSPPAPAEAATEVGAEPRRRRGRRALTKRTIDQIIVGSLFAAVPLLLAACAGAAWLLGWRP